MTIATDAMPGRPALKGAPRQVFGIDSDLDVPAYSEGDEHVPDVDPDYLFDRTTTLAILAGFAKNRRVIVTGYHGTGKRTTTNPQSRPTPGGPRPASTGRACASTSTATSAAST